MYCLVMPGTVKYRKCKYQLVTNLEYTRTTYSTRHRIILPSQDALFPPHHPVTAADQLAESYTLVLSQISRAVQDDGINRSGPVSPTLFWIS